jgi:hypothetical protein
MMSIASSMPNQLRPSFWQPQFVNSQPSLVAMQFSAIATILATFSTILPSVVGNSVNSAATANPRILPPPPDNLSRTKSSSRPQNLKALPSFGTIMSITGGSTMEFETKSRKTTISDP